MIIKEPLRIRVDDFPCTKLNEWESGQHSIEKFKEFDSIIPVKYLLGVIPINCEKVGHWPVSEKAVYGLHGFWHDESRINEFKGYGQNDIASYLISGIEKIEKNTRQKPSVYMPPHNDIDFQTLNACKSIGINTITCGPGTHFTVYPLCNHLSIKPLTSRPPVMYGRTDEILQILDSSTGEFDPYEFGGIITLHWTWENNIGFSYLKEFMNRISDRLVDFE
jgi:hypothetical protein